jgi:SAM-dependent methyltransferase
MTRDAEYNDPRLLEVYDAEGPWGRDDEYFFALVNETPGARVLDLGCGTGRLAIRLAAAGHLVTGIDPSPASLSAAHRKPGAARVTWTLGTASAAPQAAFDIVLMTGHVAQFLIAEQEWTDTLEAVWRALVPGGRLAFHAYDPGARVWERWNATDSRRNVTLSDGADVHIWTDINERTADVVSYSQHYRFSDGTELRSDSSLRFWSEARWRDSVVGAGFAVERVHGGWRGQPVGAGDGELIIVARRQPQRTTS